MDNAEVSRIAHDRSPAEVEKIWAQLSAHCPNFKASAH